MDSLNLEQQKNFKHLEEAFLANGLQPGMKASLIPGIDPFHHRTDLAEVEITQVTDDVVVIRSCETQGTFRLWSDSRGSCGWGRRSFTLLPDQATQAA